MILDIHTSLEDRFFVLVELSQTIFYVLDVVLLGLVPRFHQKTCIVDIYERISKNKILDN